MGILSDKRVVSYVLQVLVGSGDYDEDESEEYDYRTYFNNQLWRLRGSQSIYLSNK